MGCYNKISLTGWIINKRYLFLTVLEARKSKIKAPIDLWLERALFLVHRQLFSPWRRGKELSRVPKGMNPIHEDCFLMT